jgi:3-oxoacyl-[acyl-carrier-protein] synthase I
MSPLAVNSVGAFTSVGTNARQTMSSLRTWLSLPQEMPFVGNDGEPIVAMPTPLHLEGVMGPERLLTMALFALDECACGREEEAAPLLLCAPEPAELTLHWERFLAELTFHAVGRIDERQSEVFPTGRAAVAAALARAQEIVGSGRAPACYVGAVDSLVDGDRLERLRLKGRIRDEATAGFTPGEGAVFLRVSGTVDASTLAIISGIGVAHEEATRTSEKTNTGVALAKSMRDALAQSGMAMGDVGFFAHDASGERFGFNEVGFALARMRPKKMVKWTPTLSVGEIGAAIGPLAVGYLAFLLCEGGAPGPVTMFVTASDGPSRGTIIVSQLPRQDEAAKE